MITVRQVCLSMWQPFGLVKISDPLELMNGLIPGEASGVSVTGRCRCGAVRYALALSKLPTIYVCHCLDCQTWSGSAFGLHAMLPAELIAASGPLVIYEHTGASDRASAHYVCGDCHTRIYNINDFMPDIAILRAGTLDLSSDLEPAAHIWVKRKQQWLSIPAEIPQWSENPTPEQFEEAMRARRDRR